MVMSAYFVVPLVAEREDHLETHLTDVFSPWQLGCQAKVVA
jgi:hypothetical protein